MFERVYAPMITKQHFWLFVFSEYEVNLSPSSSWKLRRLQKIQWVILLRLFIIWILNKWQFQITATILLKCMNYFDIYNEVESYPYILVLSTQIRLLDNSYIDINWNEIVLLPILIYISNLPRPSSTAAKRPHFNSNRQHFQQ